MRRKKSEYWVGHVALFFLLSLTVSCSNMYQVCIQTVSERWFFLSLLCMCGAASHKLDSLSAVVFLLSS